MRSLRYSRTPHVQGLGILFGRHAIAHVRGGENLLVNLDRLGPVGVALVLVHLGEQARAGPPGHKKSTMAALLMETSASSAGFSAGFSGVYSAGFVSSGVVPAWQRPSAAMGSPKAGPISARLICSINKYIATATRLPSSARNAAPRLCASHVFCMTLNGPRLDPVNATRKTGSFSLYMCTAAQQQNSGSKSKILSPRQRHAEPAGESKIMTRNVIGANFMPRQHGTTQGHNTLPHKALRKRGDAEKSGERPQRVHPLPTSAAPASSREIPPTIPRPDFFAFSGNFLLPVASHSIESLLLLY